MINVQCVDGFQNKQSYTKDTTASLEIARRSLLFLLQNFMFSTDISCWVSQIVLIALNGFSKEILFDLLVSSEVYLDQLQKL